MKNMSYNVQKWFSEMGSEAIFDLQYRESFVFIGVFGRNDECMEKRGYNPENSKNEAVSVSQIFYINKSYSAENGENNEGILNYTSGLRKRGGF